MANPVPPPAPVSDLHPNNYYADEWIRIADGYVRIYGTFYSTAHINSVDVQNLEANRLGPAIVGFGIGSLLGYLIGAMFRTGGVLPFLLGLTAGIALGALLAFIQKDAYVLSMHMSSGEAPRLASGDPDYVNRLQDMIVRVMVLQAVR
jgi:hypothetical protein